MPRLQPDGQEKQWTVDGEHFSGHEHLVTCLAVFPQGHKVVTGSEDTTAIIWELQTGEIVRLRGHYEWILCVAVFPKGDKVITGGVDGVAIIWHVDGCIQEFIDHHKDSVTCVGVFSTQNKVITASADQTAAVWDVPSGIQCCTFRDQNSHFYVAVFPGDSRVVCGGGNTATIWLASTGTKLHEFQDAGGADGGRVSCVAVFPDGNQVVTGSTDSTAYIWSAHSGHRLQSISTRSEICSIAVHPHNLRVIIATLEDVSMWNPYSGSRCHTIQGPVRPVGVAIFPDGKQVATVHEKEFFPSVWNEGTYDTCNKLQRRGERGVWRSTEQWECELRFREHTHGALSVAVFPDGTKVITVSDDKTPAIWDAHTGDRLHVLEGHTGTVDCVAVFPNGKKVITGGSDRLAIVWDVDANAVKKIRELKGHSSNVLCVATFLRGPQASWSRRAATGSSDRSVIIWDCSSGEQLLKLEPSGKGDTDAYGSWVMGVAVSPLGDNVITVSQDNFARVWCSRKGELLGELMHKDEVTCVAIFPRQPNKAITGGADGQAIIWNARKKEKVRVLSFGHKTWVLCVAVFPGEVKVVTGSRDNKMVIWNTITGFPSHVLSDRAQQVLSVAVYPSGEVITGSSEGTAVVWATPSTKKVPGADTMEQKWYLECTKAEGYSSDELAALPLELRRVRLESRVTFFGRLHQSRLFTALLDKARQMVNLVSRTQAEFEVNVDEAELTVTNVSCTLLYVNWEPLPECQSRTLQPGLTLGFARPKPPNSPHFLQFTVARTDPPRVAECEAEVDEWAEAEAEARRRATSSLSAERAMADGPFMTDVRIPSETTLRRFNSEEETVKKTFTDSQARDVQSAEARVNELERQLRDAQQDLERKARKYSSELSGSSSQRSSMAEAQAERPGSPEARGATQDDIGKASEEEELSRLSSASEEPSRTAEAATQEEAEEEHREEEVTVEEHKALQRLRNLGERASFHAHAMGISQMSTPRGSDASEVQVCRQKSASLLFQADSDEEAHAARKEGESARPGRISQSLELQVRETRTGRGSVCLEASAPVKADAARKKEEAALPPGLESTDFERELREAKTRNGTQAWSSEQNGAQACSSEQEAIWKAEEVREAVAEAHDKGGEEEGQAAQPWTPETLWQASLTAAEKRLSQRLSVPQIPQVIVTSEEAGRAALEDVAPEAAEARSAHQAEGIGSAIEAAFRAKEAVPEEWYLECIAAEGADLAALPESQRRLALSSGPMIVGRREFAALLSQAPSVLDFLSRKHLQLELHQGELTATNMSSNPLYVDQELISKGERRRLLPGQALSFAKLQSRSLKTSHVFLQFQVRRTGAEAAAT